MTVSTPLTRSALQASVSRLSPLSRLVFLLHATEEVPLVKIASRLGLTPQETEHELARALTEIDRQIGTISAADAVAPGAARD